MLPDPKYLDAIPVHGNRPVLAKADPCGNRCESGHPEVWARSGKGSFPTVVACFAVHLPFPQGSQFT